MSTKTFNLHVPWLMQLTINDFGVSVEDAAAAWGNAGQESGGFESLQEIRPTVAGSRGGYGPFQWTGPRRVAYENYCKRNNYNPANLMVAYKFFFVETKTTHNGAWVAAVKAASGLTAKVVAFERAFERAGVKHYDSRVTWAQKALEIYMKHPERRQVPAEYQMEKPPMEPVVKPIPASKSTSIISAAVVVLLSVGGLFWPWLQNVDANSTTAIIQQIISIGTLIFGALAGYNRYNAVDPIKGSQAEQIWKGRMEAALETPAPGQQAAAPQQQGLMMGGGFNPFDFFSQIFNRPDGDENQPTATASVGIGGLISFMMVIVRLARNNPELIQAIKALLEMLKNFELPDPNAPQPQARQGVASAPGAQPRTGV